MRVMIAVTHLLGTGHLARALTLGRAFAAAGHRVLVASGGMSAPQLDAGGVGVLQLPPIRSDGTDFTCLLNEAGTPADADMLACRQALLCKALTDLAPDILITELFPFGRRVLSDEFLALLAAAETLPRRPVVLASVRDILAPPSKPSRVARTEAILTRHYDAVLVHSDPHVTPLDASWPVSDAVAARLRYTGYVAPAPAGPHPDRTGEGEILVSAGGGAVGDALFHSAIAAAALRPDLRWRLLVGGGGNRLAGLRARAGGNVVIEPARPDFRQMLHHAAASVSMCGYNTALDLLQAGTPSVLIPFDDGGEVEQGLRAQSLAALPGFEVLRSADLDATRLGAAVTRAVQAERRGDPGLGFDGAARSVEVATQMAQARP
jgi:predicted glycosyltransferase